MADPVSLGVMAAVSMGTTLAGSLIGASGAQSQAGAQSAGYLYQAGVSETNRRIALQNADYERAVGGVEARRQAIKDRQEMGKTRAAKGASGLDVDIGSPADVQESQRLIAKSDQDLIRTNAARRAYGYDVEAYGHGASAEMYRLSARGARTAGNINAASSILGGISSVSGQWSRGSSAGLFGGSSSSAYYGGMNNPRQIGSLY